MQQLKKEIEEKDARIKVLEEKVAAGGAEVHVAIRKH
jgi:hypothetical protein